ncbi:MAG: hypothetical protein WDM80_10750 [Limisphaerales bacterium]
MKKSFIFVVVVVALTVNLVAGARIYLASAQAGQQKDSADANPGDVRQRAGQGALQLCGRHKPDL